MKSSTLEQVENPKIEWSNNEKSEFNEAYFKSMLSHQPNSLDYFEECLTFSYSLKYITFSFLLSIFLLFDNDIQALTSKSWDTLFTFINLFIIIALSFEIVLLMLTKTN